MRKISLTDKAQSDLDGVVEHLVKTEGWSAIDAAMAALEMLESLSTLEIFPGAGRPSPTPDVRELVLTKFPYFAPYRVKGDTIEVLRILHHRTERTDKW
ncbi:ParE toxin of type II toxin-antitoxin system, parDE [compost metagenome]